MAVTLRGRKTAYDNAAVGSATGTERTITGDAPPSQKVGGLDNIAVGSAYPTTVIADDIQVSVVTLAGERLG